jgi:uncharacterized membrane protein YkgB
LTDDFSQVLGILGVIAGALLLIGMMALREERNRKKLKFLRFK